MLRNITAFLVSDFRLFIVYFQIVILVKLVSHSKPSPLTCLVLSTGHFLLRATRVWELEHHLPHTYSCYVLVHDSLWIGALNEIFTVQVVELHDWWFSTVTVPSSLDAQLKVHILLASFHKSASLTAQLIPNSLNGFEICSLIRVLLIRQVTAFDICSWLCNFVIRLLLFFS